MTVDGVMNRGGTDEDMREDIKQPICDKCKHIDFHEPACPASVRHILSVKGVGVVGCKWFKGFDPTASLSEAEADQGVSNLEPL